MPTDPEREFDDLMRAILGAMHPDDSARVRDSLTASSPRLQTHRAAWLRRQSISLRIYRTIKRIAECSLAILIVIATLPLQLAITLAILCFDPPVVFASERFTRTGFTGKLFTFNTRYTVRAEKMLRRAVERKQGDRPLKDPRITPIGHLLRYFGLQFLPSLYLVIAGRLSIVGSHPVYHPSIYRHIPEADLLPTVPPRAGLPGLVPMEYLYADADDMSAQNDLICIERYYATHASPWLDVRILLGAVLRTLRLPRSAVISLLRLPARDQITTEEVQQHPFLKLPDEKTQEKLQEALLMEAALG